jgi:hypothetical protein
MIFPPFLFWITRIGTYPCIYMLLAFGDEASRFETAIKNGTTPLVEIAPISCNTAIRSLYIQTVLFGQWYADHFFDFRFPFNQRIIFVTPVNRFDYIVSLPTSNFFNRLLQNHI